MGGDEAYGGGAGIATQRCDEEERAGKKHSSPRRARGSPCAHLLAALLLLLLLLGLKVALLPLLPTPPRWRQAAPKRLPPPPLPLLVGEADERVALRR